MGRCVLSNPILGFRFSVVFFKSGLLPNILDIRFQKVSGLSVEVKTTSINEGGQNFYSQQLPDRIQHGNLVLERGMIVGSFLNVDLNVTMSTFDFKPSNVLVTLHNEIGIPLAAWNFIKAYPVKWATSDLNAKDDEVVIDTMELAYTRMVILRI